MFYKILWQYVGLPKGSSTPNSWSTCYVIEKWKFHSIALNLLPKMFLSAVLCTFSFNQLHQQLRWNQILKWDPATETEGFKFSGIGTWKVESANLPGPDMLHVRTLWQRVVMRVVERLGQICSSRASSCGKDEGEEFSTSRLLLMCSFKEEAALVAINTSWH